MAETVIAMCSVVIAALAWLGSRKQAFAQRKNVAERAGASAVEHFSSADMAACRYELYDLLNEIAAAAAGKLPSKRTVLLRTQFMVGPNARRIPPRHVLARRWAETPADTPEVEEIRFRFLRLSAAFTAGIDAFAKAGTSSAESAEYIRTNVGRLLVWWLLVWPGGFDHTNNFLFSRFVINDDIRHARPSKPSRWGNWVVGARRAHPQGKYRDIWRTNALWSQKDWDGALENYRSLSATMMPGDEWSCTVKINVEESIYGSLGDPSAYPSDRPRQAYFVDGDTGHELHWSWTLDLVGLAGGEEKLNERLRSMGEATLEDRVVQIAFGANRDIANLAWKFKNYCGPNGETVSDRFIILPGVVPGADVVACNIGYWGYVYAALALHRAGVVERPDIADAEAPVSVLLLNREQMHAMHLSEGVPAPGVVERAGVSCDVAEIAVRVFGKEIDAQLYALPLPFMALNANRMVAFKKADTSSSGLLRYTQREMWAGIIAELGDALGLHDDELIPELLTEKIRLGALKGATPGGRDDHRGELLFNKLRSLIIAQLSVQLPDGMPDLPTRGLLLRSDEAAWEFSPQLPQEPNDETQRESQVRSSRSQMAGRPPTRP